jgi:hypothetical protein
MIRRIYGPASLPNAAGTRYTAPAGIRAIIRHIHVSNPTAGIINLTLSIGADAAGTRLFDAYPIAAGAVYDHWCAYALEPTEILAGFGSAAGLVVTADAELEAA